jgi:hypothetical protein
VPCGYLGDQEVDDDLALRRQQRTEPGLPRGQLLDVGRDEPVEEVAGVLARDLDHAPIWKKRCFHSQNWLFFQVPWETRSSRISPAKLRR